MTDASLADRWSFLDRWCLPLRGHIKLDALACEGACFFDTWTNHLLVTICKYEKDVQQYWRKVQLVREGLALLAAVAYVDDAAWKFLLLNSCQVAPSYPSDTSFERDVPAKFVVLRRLLPGEAERQDEQELVYLCGVHQREHPSPEYLDALKRIAEISGRKSGDVLVPVRVHTSTCRDDYPANIIAAVAKLQKEEQIIKQQWQELQQRGEQHVNEGIRCTLVLEPMVLDFHGCMITAETAKMMENVVQGNVWASQVALRVETPQCLARNTIPSKLLSRQLLASVFDSTKRSRELANGLYHFEEKPGSDDRAPLQFGRVYLEFVVPVRDEEMDLPALFSAIAVSKTTRELTLQIDHQRRGGDFSVVFWKWVAYAFFSRRARTHCSVESLVLIDVDYISPEEVVAFAAILSSSHPEEDLFGSPHGSVEERDATLNAGAPIRANIDARGQSVAGSRLIRFDAPIRFVRTFSDNGTMKWLNVLIPALGWCQVMRDDLVFDPVDEPEVPSTELTSFTIRFHGFASGIYWNEDLLPFLLALMPSLTFVKVVCPFDNLDISLIVRSCPNLEKMELWRGRMNVWYDFSKCRALNEPISALNVDGWRIGTLPTDLISAPLCRSLCRLFICRLDQMIIEEDDGSGFNPEFKAIVNMLAANKDLERLDLLHLPTQYRRYLSEFKTHHLEPINGSTPLAKEIKAAFLSVVSSSTFLKKASKKKNTVAKGRRHPICQLNQDTVSRIFSFAHAPVLRQVYVELIDDEKKDAEDSSSVSSSELPDD